MEGRRQRRKEQSRDRLSRSALTLFSTRGITLTRVEDITEAADVGKGVFYNYFDSKDALISMLMAEGLECLLKRCWMDVEPQPTPHERLRALVEVHGTFFTEHPDYGHLLHQARGHVDTKKRIPRALQLIYASYLDQLARMMRVPAPDSSHRIHLGAAIAGAIFGYRSFCLAAGQEPDYAALGALLAQGLLPVAAPLL